MSPVPFDSNEMDTMPQGVLCHVWGAIVRLLWHSYGGTNRQVFRVRFKRSPFSCFHSNADRLIAVGGNSSGRVTLAR